MNTDGRGEEDLQGVEGGKTVIKYIIREKESVFHKKSYYTAFCILVFFFNRLLGARDILFCYHFISRVQHSV